MRAVQRLARRRREASGGAGAGAGASAREQSRLALFDRLSERDSDAYSEDGLSEGASSESDDDSAVRISKDDVDSIVTILKKLRATQNEVARDNRKLRKVLLRAFAATGGEKLEGNNHSLELRVKKRFCVDQKALFANPVDNNDLIQRLRRKGLTKMCETKRIFIDDELEKSEVSSSEQSEEVSALYNKYW